MQEELSRDEVIRIFRKFARLGLAKERLTPIQVYKKIDLLCVSRRSKLDMLSVYDTLRLFELNGESEVLLAIDRVYFEGNAYRLTKQEKGARVMSLARELHCDDRTVYRRLERARQFYARIREKEGLIGDV